MPRLSKTPDQDGQVADAVQGNWVDTFAPSWSRPYLRLSRADRPIGTWLLLLPCWWGLLLGILTDGHARMFDLWIFFGCALGAFLMRGAGCTWNDITDRNFDAAVERTKSRPIPSGQVSVFKATIWMGLQALISLLILVSFNTNAIILGFASLLPVLIYPFAKRFTWWPQVFLGIAFNWGILLAFAAHTGYLTLGSIVLYFAAIFWTLFYDTIYAHQDVEDDEIIGIKSTARLFGESSPKWLFVFAVVSSVLVYIALFLSNLSSHWVAVLGVLGFLGHMMWQLINIKLSDAENLLRIFRSNRDAGMIIVLFFAISTVV